MTWTSISNAAVAVGGIPSSTTVTALRDNPGAMAAAENGAPVIFAGWHPPAKVSVGDGEDGLEYSHAVNGTQATVTLPDFEDGYEYRIICRDMSHNSGSNQTLQIGFYDNSDTLLGGCQTGSYNAATDDFRIDVQVMMPRLAALETDVLVLGKGVTVTSFGVDMNGGKIQRAKVFFSGGSIDAGKIWMLRRREYASSP
jgi:hypothetical protein